MYLDNAATTLKKPQRVYDAINYAMRQAAGYARGDYQAAQEAGEMVYACREEVAGLLGAKDPTRVVFTMNATHALNIAIHALAPLYDTVAVTGYEHNAVMRPLAQHGIMPLVLRAPLFDGDALLEGVEQALKDGVRLFVLCHVSNVFGAPIPLDKIAQLLEQYDASLILDASQSAGVLEIDVGKMPCLAAVCMPGHKALYGPQGTGVLLSIDDRIAETPLITGGTGSLSELMEQPSFLPDALESGTPNVPGIAGLREGVKFVRQKGVRSIAKHERKLVHLLTAQIQDLPGVTLYRGAGQTGVLSFSVADTPSEVVSNYLKKRSVATRSGLHCAPLAHESAGTQAFGTVRVSMSAFTKKSEIEGCAQALEAFVKNQ